VSEDERGVRHLVAGVIEADAEVEGHIDWGRRFDHMQQHSGQHLLSRVFVNLRGAATIGFHLGEEECTIDLDRADVADKDFDEAERRVNELIFKNIPVMGTIHSAEEYEAMCRDVDGPDIVSRLPEKGENGGMRSRLPAGASSVRVIEIEGVDRATCCGTHCRSTGEIGLVKILGMERVRQNARIKFICGGRALRDYSAKHGMLRTLASAFSTGWRELGDIVPRLVEENRELSKSCEALRTRLASSMTGEIAAPTGAVGQFALVKRIVTLAEGVSLKDIALSAREGENRIVLLGVAADTGLLAFACSPGVPLSAGELMKNCVTVMGGRGGGGKDFAQGGGGDPARVQDALDEAERMVRETLE
jgi:alanyl-tRNA synthetase